VAVKLEQALSSRYRLVTRTQIAKVLQELKLGVTDLTDQTKAQQFGKMVGARFLISGSVVQLGPTMTIAAQIFAVETGVIRQTAEVEARDVAEFNALAAEIARILPMTNEEKQKYLDAQVYYPKLLAEGKDLMGKTDWAGAVTVLEKAQACKATPEVAYLLATAGTKAEDIQRCVDEVTKRLGTARGLTAKEDWQGVVNLFSLGRAAARAVPGRLRPRAAQDLGRAN
jgi:hypothetical protein